MGSEALVLTVKTAEERGFSGDGPFTLGGVFPGEWTPGRPLRISTLGFESADDAEAALVEAFEEPLLEWATVSETEGYPERFNHAASEMEARHAAQVADVAEEPDGTIDVSKLRTHAQADAAAAALNIEFSSDPRPTLEEKVSTIAAMIAGGAVDTTGAEPRAVTEGNPPPGGDGGGDDEPEATG